MSLIWPALEVKPHGGEFGPVVCRAPVWVMRGAGPGQLIENAIQAFARREVTAVARADEFGCRDRQELLQVLHNTARGIISAAGGWSQGSTLELLYVTEPRADQPTRVHLYLTAKAVGSDERSAAESAEEAVESACAALPSGYRSEPIPGSRPLWTKPPEIDAIEVRKQEELLRPQLSNVPSDYYYVAYPITGDGVGWPQFGEVLARTREVVTVSLVFSPTMLDGMESSVIGSIATQLEWWGRPRQEPDVMGNLNPAPADASAAAALPIWQGYQQRLRQCVLARAMVMGVPGAALSVAKALGTAVSASREPAGGAAPVRQRPRNETEYIATLQSSAALDIVPWGGHSIWNQPDAPHALRRLPYLYGIDEAATLAILPVPEEHGARGFPLAKPARGGHIRDAVEEGPAVELGVFEHHGQSAGGAARIPLPAINRHTLVVGAPGSGKTTTVLSLLVRLWREHEIPFLAIEPTKTEYRSMLSIPGMERLRVITLGRDDVAPMRMNPLAPPPGVRRESHVNAVMAVFRAALPLMPPLPQLLEMALERTYENAGWDYDTAPEDGKQAPTLRDLMDTYQNEFDQLGYAGPVADNLRAALTLRLRSLTRGTRGLLLDTVESVDFTTLMERPVVIELDEISDREDKAVLAAFLLDRIRAAARARRSTGGRLAHVTVLEEAHRLLSRLGGGAEDSPQAAAIRSFCDAIAELRALGEGFIISSQSPSALADAAVANTGTRIVHRLESAADRDIVLADLDAADVERAAAARLDRGEAVVRWPGMNELEFVAVRSDEGVDSGRPMTDEDVMRRMAAENEAVWRLVPYRMCTRELCPGGCSRAVRARGKAIARDTGGEAGRLWTEHGGKAKALAPIAGVLARKAGGDAQVAYCAAVHLSLQGDAFVFKGRTPPRKQLAAGIREAASKVPSGGQGGG